MSSPAILEVTASTNFDIEVPVVIIGAGACGLCAALAATDAGVQALIIERDSTPAGSTSLSSGMIPAAGTIAQQEAGIVDSASLMATDIQGKAHGEAVQSLVDSVSAQAGPAIDWLREQHNIRLDVVEGFLYPGHAVPRMHAPASRTGAELQTMLLQAASQNDISMVTDARVTTLLVDDFKRIRGVACERPDGKVEQIGCEQLILACNGFGGSVAMVREFIPEMANAQYFGHPGNQGDAIRWGQALGAISQCLGAYQGHGSVATPHQILITWALMMEGGIQINANGERFSNEHDGYSEQAVRVLAQPHAVAWNIYDEHLHRLGLEFEDYRNAVEQGAVKNAVDVSSLAEVTDVPAEQLAANISLTQSQTTCPFGRDFSQSPGLTAPFYAIKVTGALFHTQGGLAIDADARVLTPDGPLPNLFAGGGAACGVSGEHVWGYLSGNGLLTAVTFGRIAGMRAAERIAQ